MSGGLRLNIAGFPTTIQPMFVVVIGILGWYPGITAGRVVMWIVLATGAIMWHELGHATAARRLGASPEIELYGMGGLTRWVPPRDPSRADLIGVTLAGPGAGLLIGALTGIGVAIAGGLGTGDVRYVVLVLLFTNVGWSLLNLLPVLPLDGGHVMAELLPGDRRTRQRRAAIASIAIGAIAAAVLVMQGIVFGGLVFIWAVASNLTALRSHRESERRQDAADESREALLRLAVGDPDALPKLQQILAQIGPASAGLRAVAIETAAATGNASAARSLLDDASPTEPVAPGLFALVFAVESAGRDGVAELIEILGREPTAVHARWLAVALDRGGRLAQLPAHLQLVDGRATPDVINEAAAAAENLGDPTTAAGVRSLLDPGPASL